MHLSTGICVPFSIGNSISLQAFIRKDDPMNTILEQFEDKIKYFLIFWQNYHKRAYKAVLFPFRQKAFSVAARYLAEGFLCFCWKRHQTDYFPRGNPYKVPGQTIDISSLCAGFQRRDRTGYSAGQSCQGGAYLYHFRCGTMPDPTAKEKGQWPSGTCYRQP